MLTSACRRVISAACLVSAIAGSATFGRAEDPVSARPTVCNIKVLSDKVPDVSNLDAWKKSFIKDDMTDQEKSLAIWRSVVMFQQQDAPPNEYLQHEDAVYDPIKMFNVYGYAMCCNHCAHMDSLARYIGLTARGWGIGNHSVCEFSYGGAWHHFDSSLVDYFVKPDGTVAGVEEVTKAVQDWYAKNPEYTDSDKKARDKKLRALQSSDGWQGWKEKGPALITSSPTVSSRGWWPAHTHGFYTTMEDFDGTGGGAGGKAFIYEYCASIGYQVNIQLRPGEVLTRNWSNIGLQINGDKKPGSLDDKNEFLLNTEKFMDKLEPKWPNLANGRVGNGTVDYKVPVGNGAFKDGALVVRMPSSYVYLDGSVSLNAVVGQGGEVDVDLSDNNGLDWKPAGKIVASGEQKIDLSNLIMRRYDYQLRVTMKGKETGITAMTVHEDIQHSQRPLPALGQGENKIAFSAGAQESTVTIEANNNLGHKDKQVVYTDFHPTLEGLSDNLGVTGEKGMLTVPVAVPGEMTRLRISACYRTWDDQGKWDFEASFDGGKTFKKVGEGPPQKGGRNAFCIVNDVPAGTKSALVRYVGTGGGRNVLGSFRIDADYKSPSLGFSPIKVTYLWEEDGKPMKDIHVAKTADDSYTINCAGKPTMKSIVLEVAE